MDSDIYCGILSKLETIKNKIIKIKEYNNKKYNVLYLEKLNSIMSDINYLNSTSDDLYDLFLENVDENTLDNVDKYKKVENMIYKKSYETFLPLILQMQIMLKNK
jgi:hypothetical protein